MTRDDIRAEKTIYSPYIIKNGERPDQISYKEYGDEQYYWIILQINEITDYYNEWPLSQYELDEYITKKYGVVGADEVRHYETTSEIKMRMVLYCPWEEEHQTQEPWWSSSTGSKGILRTIHMTYPGRRSDIQ